MTTRRAPTDPTYRMVQRLVAGLFRLFGLRITVRGAEHLPATGPAVIASNHTGFLDSPSSGTPPASADGSCGS